MPLTTRYFISVLLLLIAGIVQAQTKNAEPGKSFLPTGVRVGTDLIDLGKTFSGKTFKGWEVNGDIDFSNYYFAVDIGSWAKDLTLNNGSYSNSGGYFRLGIDVNFLGKDPDKNMFFFGFRVGHAQFSESVDYLTTPRLFPAAPTHASNGNVRGEWGELTTGLRVKVWQGLWMGYTARMKFAPGTRGSGPDLTPYDVPGYGIISQKPWWGFNYQVFWRFNWKPAGKK